MRGAPVPRRVPNGGSAVAVRAVGVVAVQANMRVWSAASKGTPPVRGHPDRRGVSLKVAREMRWVCQISASSDVWRVQEFLFEAGIECVFAPRENPSFGGFYLDFSGTDSRNDGLNCPASTRRKRNSYDPFEGVRARKKRREPRETETIGNSDKSQSSF